MLEIDNDVEMSWKQTVYLWANMKARVSDRQIFLGCLKMANICDLIKQGQSEGKITIIYPNGQMEYKEVKEDG